MRVLVQSQLRLSGLQSVTLLGLTPLTRTLRILTPEEHRGVVRLLDLFFRALVEEVT